MHNLPNSSRPLGAKLTAYLDINSSDWEVGHEEAGPATGASAPLTFGVPRKLEHVCCFLQPAGSNSLLAIVLSRRPPGLQVEKVRLLLGGFLEVQQLLGLGVLTQGVFGQHQLVVSGLTGQAGVITAKEWWAGDLLVETLL